MDKKFTIILSTLGVLLAAFIINITIQKGYKSNDRQLILIDRNDINKIIISAKEDAIELSIADSIWTITGNDTLNIKENVIDNFFENFFDIKKKHLVTSKENNWNNYGVSPEEGTHLALINQEGQTIAYFVFGNSQVPGEYNICYVRSNQTPEVYLLDSNIMYQLQTNPTYWGEKPVSNEVKENTPTIIE